MSRRSVDSAALLGQAHEAFGAGDYDAALGFFNKAGAASGSHAEALIGAANVHLVLGDLSAARRATQRALQMLPGSAEALCQMARVELLSGNLDRGLTTITKALGVSPGLAYAIQIQGEILRLLGKKQDAYDLLKQSVDGGERHPGIVIGYAELAASIDGPERCLAIGEIALEVPGLSQSMRANILHRVGAALDKTGAYDQAFAYASRANKLAAPGWDIGANDAMIQERIDAATPETLAAMPRSKAQSPCPLFVMGLPRSGTSLTEQMLASHSKVFGAGELGDMPRIAGDLLTGASDCSSMAARMQSMPQHMLDSRARAQLKRLARLGKSALHVVDKQPQNYLFLPEIASVFPGARVVLCTRHPLDNCLSCFMTNLGQRHGWSSDLVALGHYYVSATRVMEHFAAHVATPILEVRYSDLVMNHEATVRAMVQHVGLDWENACLRHDETNRVVLTASAEQATEPIYTSSLGRWRNYERHLGPLIETLESLGVAIADDEPPTM